MSIEKLLHLHSKEVNNSNCQQWRSSAVRMYVVYATTGSIVHVNFILFFISVCVSASAWTQNKRDKEKLFEEEIQRFIVCVLVYNAHN